MPLTTHIPTARLRRMSRKELIEALAQKMMEEGDVVFPKLERNIARSIIWWNIGWWPIRSIRLATLLYLRGRVK